MPPVPPPPVVNAALALRRVLLRAADSLLPPWAAVWDRTMGVARTEIIGVLASLGVADELAAGPLTAAELASRLGVAADALHRVMRVAAADGLFQLDRPGRFPLPPLRRAPGGGSPAALRPRGGLLA